MAQDLSIEYTDNVVFITMRTIGSRLWFVNNPELHQKILAYLAKYQEEYGFKLYGFIIMGNHYHMLAHFPKPNRSAFLRAFDSIIARILSKYVPAFQDGSLWGRRPKVQVVPNNEDVLHTFKYTVLNPVSSGLCQKLSEFNSYNCLNDALSGVSQKYRLVDWADYDNRKRYNKDLRPKDCEKEYTLTFSRLPGYEKLSRQEYAQKIRGEVDKRRLEIVSERIAEKQGFGDKKSLRGIKAGAKPRHTKTSSRDSKRPLVLTLCAETREKFTEIYFATLEAYKQASKRYREGHFKVKFPPGTYRPIVPVSKE